MSQKCHIFFVESLTKYKDWQTPNMMLTESSDFISQIEFILILKDLISATKYFSSRTFNYHLFTHKHKFLHIQFFFYFKVKFSYKNCFIGRKTSICIAYSQNIGLSHNMDDLTLSVIFKTQIVLDWTCTPFIFVLLVLNFYNNL